MAQLYLSHSSSSRIFEDVTEAQIDLDNPRIQDSVYVFPSPPSAEPGDDHYSLDSLSQTPELSSPSYSCSDRPSLLLDDEPFMWDDIPSHFHSRTTSFGSLLPPRQPLPRHSFSSLRAKRSQDYISPHPRLHIPLLSFFLSFLSLDETILRLLTQAPTSSTLFPGQSMLEESVESSDSEATGEVHGIEKLLHRPKETDILKEGLAESSLQQEGDAASQERTTGSWMSAMRDLTAKLSLGSKKDLGAG